VFWSAVRQNKRMNRRRAVRVSVAALLLAIILGFSAVVVPLIWVEYRGGLSMLDEGWNQLMSQVRQPWVLSIAYALNSIGGGWIATLLVPLVIIGILWAVRGWRVAIFAAIAFLSSAALVQLLKHLFGRARPTDLLVTSDFGSFPSGHTANAATIAVVLWLVFPRLWVALVGAAWALLMALSRTLLSVHWMSDTIAGLLVGVAAALLATVFCAGWLLRDGDLDGRSVKHMPHSPEPSSSPQIRPYQPADLEALYEVCVKTADAGSDATGLFTDDKLWGDVFAVPYAQRHPDLAWVVETADQRVVGYLLATDDTNGFEQWFRDVWWPSRAAHYPLSGEEQPTRQDRIIAYAAGRAPGNEPNVLAYPAHLHIDLLPETQGHGVGRRLMQTLFDELNRRGVPALHLGMDPANTGAAVFYQRLGFTPLPAAEGAMTLGIRLEASAPASAAG